jgi:hypothetical protein
MNFSDARDSNSSKRSFNANKIRNSLNSATPGFTTMKDMKASYDVHDFPVNSNEFHSEFGTAWRLSHA